MSDKFKQERQNLQEEVYAIFDCGIYGTGFVQVTYDLEHKCIVKKRINPTLIKIVKND